MAFFKIRFRSILIVASFTFITFMQCGGNLSAQVQNLSANDPTTLKTAFAAVAGASAGTTVNITLNTTVKMDGTVPELYVPVGVTVNIIGSGSGIVDGQEEYRGFVIQTADGTSNVTIEGITFRNCVAQGGDGGNGQVAGGGGAGLGGAIYVRGTVGNVSLTDVLFKNNEAIGGAGGSVINGSKTAGGGGGLGGDGGSGTSGETGYAAGGGGGFGDQANGASSDGMSDGGDGMLENSASLGGGLGYVNAGTGNTTPGGDYGGGGGSAVAQNTQNNAAGGGGGEGGADGSRIDKNFYGGDGAYGGGGGGSTNYGGDGGFGGGGGGGNSYGGDGGFGGGGGGAITSNNAGIGGYGAGNGGNNGSGGGGLGAGGAIYVEGGVSLNVTYTDSTSTNNTSGTLFSNNTSEGGTATGNATSGEALGAIFLNGNSINFESTLSSGSTNITTDINDISNASNFDKTISSELQTYSGGVNITGGSVTLKGDNNYAGLTTVANGATLIANGKTGNAIGDLSEVQLSATGTLQIDKSETIGFLSGTGTVELTGGKTLIVAGDEDANFFGQGINAATGLVVGDFTGKIDTDGIANTKEQLVKTGTGRLTLGNDNSNLNDEFTTTIYQGTVVLGDAKGFGGGDVYVKNIDTGTGNQLRNVIEANKNMTDAANGAVMNNFIISSTGKDLDGVQQNFNAMVVGGDFDIQFGKTGANQGGQITGGNLLINMDNATNKVILANQGYDATAADYLSDNINRYAETQIKSGTLVVHEGDSTTLNRADTLGIGSVRILEGSGNNARLSAADDGMTIDNNIVIEADSNLTLKNETGVNDYTLSGNISGKGGLILDLTLATDSVTLTNKPNYFGATHLEKGTLIVDRTGLTDAVVGLFDLSAMANGTLEIVNADLYAIINKGVTATYSGEIVVDAGKQIIKTGEGTWVFDASTAIAPTQIVEVYNGALQLNADGVVQDILLTARGQLVVDSDVTLGNLSTDALYYTNVTVNSGNTLTLNDVGGASGNALYNSWAGDGSVLFESDVILYNTSYDTWEGTMEVDDAKKLSVKAPGALGVADKAKVILNTGSVLDIDTYVPGYYPTTEEIAELTVDGDATLNVASYSTFIADDVTGTGELTKTGAGTWGITSALSYSEDITLEGGAIHLMRTESTVTPGTYDYNADLGSGDLIVAKSASDDIDAYLVVDADGTKTVANDIVLQDVGKDLNIGVYDYSTTGNSEVVFDGAISGSGGINFLGGGTIVFDTVDKSYTGDTNIADGTLRVNVDTSTDYYVNSGGTLEFSGTRDIGSNDITVNSGGTLTGVDVTTTGDLTFNSGSLFEVDSNASPTFSAGNVTIANGSVAHISGTNTAGITGLITAGSHDGMFWFTDDVYGKRATGTWNGNDLDITYENVVYRDNTRTWDAIVVADYMNAVADNSVNGRPWNAAYPVETETAALLNHIENLQSAAPGSYDYALLELGGQVNASIVTAQVQTTSNMFRSVTAQLYSIPVANESHHLPGHAIEQTQYRGQSMRSGWTGWNSGLGIFGDTSGNHGRGTHGYDFETYGMSIGIEPTYAMSRNRLGFFYAYNDTKIDTKSTLGSGHAKSNFFGAYGRFVDSMGYTAFVAGFGFDDYKTNRYVNIPNASGHSQSKFDGWQGGLYVERGLSHMALTRFNLQPFVGLQYLHISADDFSETGTNPYKLVTKSTDADSLRTNFGLRYARSFSRNKCRNLLFSASASWMHEFLDADCTTTSKWAVTQNPSTFSVLGNSLGRDWAVLGMNADWQWRHNVSLFGSYDLQLNNYQTLHVGNVGARIQW